MLLMKKSLIYGKTFKAIKKLNRFDFGEGTLSNLLPFHLMGKVVLGKKVKGELPFYVILYKLKTKSGKILNEYTTKIDDITVVIKRKYGAARVVNSGF